MTTLEDMHPSVTVLLKYEGALQFKRAYVNSVEISFYGGKARISVVPDIQYGLTWDVLGFTGTRWKYTLSSETTGYAVAPENLSDPGRAFQLQSPSESTPVEYFRVVRS